MPKIFVTQGQAESDVDQRLAVEAIGFAQLGLELAEVMHRSDQEGRQMEKVGRHLDRVGRLGLAVADVLEQRPRLDHEIGCTNEEQRCESRPTGAGRELADDPGEQQRPGSEQQQARGRSGAARGNQPTADQQGDHRYREDDDAERRHVERGDDADRAGERQHAGA